MGHEPVGEKEQKAQQRVLALFRKQPHYEYLGDWSEREDNRNIDEPLLRKFLSEKQHLDENLISRALYQLGKIANDTSKSLYDRNRGFTTFFAMG